MPTVIRPMLARVAPGPFDSDRHLFEPKWDGLRAIGFLAPDGAWLQSRRLRRWTGQFPEVTRALRALAGHSTRAVVDGELVVPDGSGRPDFEAAAARARMGAAAAERVASRRPAVYMVFDLLYLDGEDLRRHPLEGRRGRLEQWAATWPPQAAVALSPAQPRRGRALFDAACRLRLEGIMAKALASPYLEGRRTPHWLKIKPLKEEEAWIVGFVPAGHAGIRALALATPHPGGHPHPTPEALTLAGLVGTGLSAAEQRRLRALLAPLARPEPPAGLRLPLPGMRLPRAFDEVVWTIPGLRVQVRYLERTAAGWIRHASVLEVVE